MRRVQGALALVPAVSLVTWLLVAALPVPIPEGARTAEQIRQVEAQYRDALGSAAWDPSLPWRRFVAGENLSRGERQLRASELLEKLAGSAEIGAVSLAMVVPLALASAIGLAFLRRRGLATGGNAVTTFAFATPIFIPVMIAAPWVVETGALRETLAAAALMAVVPGLGLGEQIAAALLREQAADYVRTARAKGVPPTRILLAHVLPNVWPDLLDGMRPTAAALLAGSFAVEQILGLPYFGRLYVQAVVDQDPALIVVCTSLFAALVAVIGIVVELIRPALDPRARSER